MYNPRISQRPTNKTHYMRAQTCSPSWDKADVGILPTVFTFYAGQIGWRRHAPDIGHFAQALEPILPRNWKWNNYCNTFITAIEKYGNIMKTSEYWKNTAIKFIRHCLVKSQGIVQQTSGVRACTMKMEIQRQRGRPKRRGIEGVTDYPMNAHPPQSPQSWTLIMSQDYNAAMDNGQ